MQEEQKKPDEQAKPEHEIQKMSWTEIVRHVDYNDALKDKLAMDEKDSPTKIRRRRDYFSVMKGRPVKKAKPKPMETEEVSAKKREPHRNDRKAKNKRSGKDKK